MRRPIFRFVAHAAWVIVACLGVALPATGQVTWDADAATGSPQDGSGTWSTSGTNWWNGTTNVAWPNLTTSSAIFGAGSGAAGTVTVSGSVTTNAITFNSAGSGTYTISGGTVSLQGTTPTITANTNATIGSTLAGSAGLTKAGSGTLTLSGSNSYTGGTTVSAGGLVVSGTTGGGNFTVNPVSNTSTTTVEIASGGRLNASNLALKFLGGTGTAAMTVSAGGYLGASSPGIGRNSGVGTLTVNGGTAVLTGNSTLGLRGGAGIVTLNSGVYTATGTTQVGNNSIQGASITSRGTFTVAGGTATLGTLAIAGGVLNSGTNEFVIGTVNLSGAGVLTVSNTIQVADASRSTATINVSGGTLNALGIALLPGTYGDTNSSASVNVTGGSIFLGSGGITRTGTNGTASIALSGGTIGASAEWASAVPMTLSNDNGGVTVRAADAASVARNITLSGTLSGAGGLTKTGAGTLTLSGNNTYSGQTRVSAGALALGATDAISNQSNLLVDGGGFNLAGFNDTVGTVTLTSGSIFGSGTLTSSFIYDMQAGAVSAILSGSVGLRKTGSGRVQLTGNNSFAGTTLVEAGALIVNGGLAGDVVVSAGAMLGGAGVLGKTLSGAGTISVGNSPGIGDAGAADPILGTDWDFEITGTAPTWAAGTSASVNDVLRLTDATPFLSSLGSDNAVNVLFNIGATPIEQGSYLGGFFIDNESFNLATALAAGTFRYWVAGEYGSEGQRQQFNVGADGTPVWYSLLTAYDSSLTASYVISQKTVNFGSGTITGAVTQFVVVPEPGGVIVASIGVAIVAWSLRKQRRRLPIADTSLHAEFNPR